jgi:hypothetical protein
MKSIFEYFITQLTTLNLFNEINGLCRRIEGNEPAFYNGNDEMKSITKFDFKTGVCFFLPNGAMSIADADESPIASQYFKKLSQPYSFFALIKTGTGDTDDAYYSGDLALAVLKAISLYNNKTLREDLKVSILQTDLTRIETNSETVFAELKLKPQHNLTAIRVDFSVVAQGNINCLNDLICQ